MHTPADSGYFKDTHCILWPDRINKGEIRIRVSLICIFKICITQAFYDVKE